MGIPFSCSLTDFDDLDRRLEAFLVRSMSFDGNDERTTIRSVSFNGRDSEPAMMKSFGSDKPIFKGFLSFKGRELGMMSSSRAPSDGDKNLLVRSSNSMSRENGEKLPIESMPMSMKTVTKVQSMELGNQRSQAALRLQKVYKSFRTRRQLADCAVIVEQRWWKLLDFAELKQSSISFFDIKKPETAVSRWSRAKTRAAKVGKGLSKDKRAQKLALQHWLEAIDPRHRYGHNLQFYYVKWLHCQSKQPFFYWLDIGEGKEVNFDKCPRSKLQQQCIKYLGPTERKAYEITVDDGKFFYRQTGVLVDTREGPPDAKWIFVLSTCKTLYIGKKHKGTFQHSSFLAGGATLSAGRLVVEDGILKAVWPHSGHYRPTEENFEEFMLFMREHNVDLSIVQKIPIDEEEEAHGKKGIGVADESNAKGSGQENNAQNPHLPSSRFSRRLHPKITTLEIPRKDGVINMFKREEQKGELSGGIYLIESPFDGYETADEVLSDDDDDDYDDDDDDDDFTAPKQNFFDEDEEYYEEPIPKEKIIQRINSHKGMKSYQLAQNLTCRWTTGAGPRIGCVRDYPLELQNRALVEVNLSPRGTFSSPRRSFRPSPRVLTPSSVCRETIGSKSPLAVDQVKFHQLATP